MNVGVTTRLRVHRLETLEALEKATAPGGILAEWDQLVEEDTLATFFQTRLWCMTWYRCYASSFRPVVLVAVDGERLAGIGSLAQGTSDGRLVFAGDDMCDYRDFVARADQRGDVVRAFVSVMPSFGADKLAIGPTAPGSPTVPYIVACVAGRRGMQTFTHSHPCWRLAPVDPTRVADMQSKKSIRQAITRYKKRGGARFRRIRSAQEWAALKQGFFAQHSLRQLFVGRTPSFEQPAKQTFFDQLFTTAAGAAHFSVLEADGRLLATHFGTLYKGTLTLGAPAFDLLEQRNSPGLLLLIELMRDSVRDGATQVDFTMGTEPYKARFGNHCVEVPIVDLYMDRVAATRRRLRDLVVRGSRATVGRVVSESTWRRVATTVRRMQAHGWRTAMGDGRGSEATRLSRVKSAVVVAARGRWTAPGTEDGGVGVESTVREKELSDFLKAGTWSFAKAVKVIRKAVRHLEEGDRIFTVVARGRLIAYGILELPKATSAENSRVPLGVGPEETAWLWWELTSSEADGRACMKLVTHMLEQALAEGSHVVALQCGAGDKVARGVAEELGLELVTMAGKA